jgi:hypothetical protein
MSQNTEQPDYVQVLKTVEIQLREHKENIKDARRAIRNCSHDERQMYRNVIRWNRKGIKEAKIKRRLIKAQTTSTWWMWLIAAILCVVILITVPGAPVAVVFAPLWIMALFGFIYILMAVKK